MTELVGECFGKGIDSRTFVPSDELVMPTAYVGVEVELEHTRGRILNGLWRTTTDGSLHHDGKEYVFANPTMGEDILTALTVLEEEFSTYHPSTGNDTSLHVHVDIRDLDFKQLARLLFLYIMYEKVLFSYCAPAREDNVFCLSVDKARSCVGNYAYIVDSIKQGDTDNLYNLFSNSARYTGVNVRATTDFGSLEFRGHRGTWRKEEILRWINILLSLKKASLDDSIDWHKPHLNVKEMGAIAFGHKVFGDLMTHFNHNTYHEHLHVGMQLTREISFFHTRTTMASMGAPASSEVVATTSNYTNKIVEIIVERYNYMDDVNILYGIVSNDRVFGEALCATYIPNLRSVLSSYVESGREAAMAMLGFVDTMLPGGGELEFDVEAGE